MPLSAVLALLLAGTPAPAPAQAPGATEVSKADRMAKAYDEAVKESTLHAGLFQLRKKDGNLYAELRKQDLGKSFLVFAQIAQGVAQGGLLGGMMRSWADEWVFEFRRVDDSVQVVRKNVRFTAKKSSPLEEAVKISFSDSIMASLDIVGESKAGNVLVKLDGLFLSDILDLGSELQAALGSGYSMNSKLSAWSSVKAFPKNMELEANLTYTSGRYADVETIPDSRYVTLTVHYSLVELPGGGFKPRLADDRVGHFVTAIKDYSSTDIEGPFVRYVYRWHIEKADPKAKRSTVKDPIIFYMEKSIPYEFRPWIRQGILEWNKAFEKVGLLDAIEVRLQSEDADWDPEDVRYNTIRWITSPHTFAVGPSHVNPLTGQTMDADILIDASWINLWTQEVGLWKLPSAERVKLDQDSPAPDTALARQAVRSDALATRRICTMTEGFRHQFALGALTVLGAGQEKGEAGDKDANGVPYWYIGAALKDLVMHEVGHTLGLRHNFKASSIRDLEALHDADTTRSKGLVGSVMDYLPVNLAPPGKKQGEYHPSTIGPYDYWAIEYSYGDVDGDEKKGLSAVASRATTAELAYASDEDVVPIYDRNLDPLVGTWDLGSDPLSYAENQLAWTRDLWDKILERVVKPGRSYLLARRAVGTLLWEIFNGGTIASRYVGGQYHYRDHKGDPGERPSFVPVEAPLQRRAVDFLARGLFADASYPLSPDLLNRLAPSHWWHWGADPFEPRLDFPLHQRIQAMQAAVLARLLSPRVLARILDTEKAVDPGSDFFTVPELLERLGKAIFAELDGAPDARTFKPREPYISAMRRNLQRLYVSMLSQLVLLVSARQATDAGLVARSELTALRERLRAVAGRGEKTLDVYSLGHLRDLADRITQVLEAKQQAVGF